MIILEPASSTSYRRGAPDDYSQRVVEIEDDLGGGPGIDSDLERNQINDLNVNWAGARKDRFSALDVLWRRGDDSG